jgi:hypothetical protein
MHPSLSPVSPLSPVTSTLEVEEEMQDASLKGASEAVLACVVPLLAHDAESNVLVGGASLKDKIPSKSREVGKKFTKLEKHRWSLLICGRRV